MNPKIVPILIVVLLISVVANIGMGVYYFLNKDTDQKVNNNVNNNVNETSEFSLVGIVYGSGLSKSDQSSDGFNLPIVKYQITNINKVLSKFEDQQDQSDIFFLKGDENVIAQFQGKCVKVSGFYDNSWKELAREDDKEIYSYFSMDKITEVASTECETYTAEIPDSELVSFKGTIKRESRPAPDISEDYQLVFLTPQSFPNQSGLEGKSIATIIVPLDESVRQLFEANIERSVTVKGYLVVGYSGLTHILVTEIQ